MKQTIAYEYTLPETSSCDQGPIAEWKPGVLTVRYDREGTSQSEWVTILFGSTIAHRFTPDISVTKFHLNAYNKICEVGNSEWLSNLKHEARQHRFEIAGDFKHYMIYFDHHGCLEVIARQFERLTI